MRIVILIYVNVEGRLCAKTVPLNSWSVVYFFLWFSPALVDTCFATQTENRRGRCKHRLWRRKEKDDAVELANIKNRLVMGYWVLLGISLVGAILDAILIAKRLLG